MVNEHSDADVARLNPSLFHKAAKSFPRSPWQAVNPPHRRGTDWGLGTHEAGVYAFLFPKAEFPTTLTIHLHRGQVTPKGDRHEVVEFVFEPGSVRDLPAGLFAAYVGRTTDLRRRLRWHFSVSEQTTAAQVRKGLQDVLNVSRHDTVEFMRRHATVVFLTDGLSGLENTANRDILELTLCARFGTPFNIKAER